MAKNQNNPESHAWPAETYRRIGKKDEAVKIARRAIALDPCHSFAHTVLADAHNPIYGMWESSNSDSTWTHPQKAVACDFTDGNAWVSIWSEAIRRGELPMMKRALHSAVKSGFFTKAALSYCRWMLQLLPEQALLMTNGDMDTYPAVALQEVENFRSDVAGPFASAQDRGPVRQAYTKEIVRNVTATALTFNHSILLHPDSALHLVAVSAP